ncbi:MAG TPA: hypothetical protein PKC96_05785 [Bacilli bacterium]|jgi:hypothetical protein|nr:hypothetical protein [Bacilli bacterium]
MVKTTKISVEILKKTATGLVIPLDEGEEWDLVYARLYRRVKNKNILELSDGTTLIDVSGRCKGQNYIMYITAKRLSSYQAKLLQN